MQAMSMQLLINLPFASHMLGILNMISLVDYTQYKFCDLIIKQ